MPLDLTQMRTGSNRTGRYEIPEIRCGGKKESDPPFFETTFAVVGERCTVRSYRRFEFREN